MRVVSKGTFAICGLVGLAIAVTFIWRMVGPREVHPVAEAIREAPPVSTVVTSGPPAIARNMNIIAPELTAQEKADLAKNFREKYKPAVEKWCSAYEGHILFHPEDLSLDDFKHRIGRNSDFFLYSFVIDGTTLTVEDRNGAAKVFYMAHAESMKALNQLPKQATEPSLKVPITKEDVIRMVKADSGVEFKPNEVVIRPTGTASVFNGGAFVDILPTGADPNNGLSAKLNLVFGPDGNLVNYERDPFF